METAETKTIEVIVNGHAKRIPAGGNVNSMLAALNIEPARVAVELNREIVRKPEWNATLIEEGAKIEIVWFVGGGRQ